MIKIEEEEKLYIRIGKLETQINYIQVDLKWLKKLIYLILIVLVGLNIIPYKILGALI